MTEKNREPYPLRLKPIFKKRIWGGQKLREIFGKDIPPFEKIGESWELADLPEDKSVIVNGQLSGWILRSAIDIYPKEITGNENFSLPFPLLIKFLDAEDILSVQVHPDTQTCRRLGKGEPKTECWYIIKAQAGAYIYKGLKSGVKRNEFAQAIKEGTVEKLLKKVLVQAGQCHFLPAGTVHSIGAGLLIAEIQTPSDTTYRVFDWNRVDEKGNSRQLHIEEALESIHFEPTEDDLSVTTEGRLVDSKYFKIDKVHQTDSCEVLLLPGQMKTLIILTGQGKIVSAETTEAVEFHSGDIIVIPAAYEGAIRFAADTEYLNVTI
ncbi:MAG: class I mannose-6-phosphate isomerase [Sedimentisphaerales bacterium]|nr:class I mannose-6-phosphate isomerase [Sedimentisphaerales bacterium]